MVKTAAVITFHNPNKYSKKGAKAIAKWLRDAAKDIIKHHKDMSKECRYRYWYQEEL